MERLPHQRYVEKLLVKMEKIEKPNRHFEELLEEISRILEFISRNKAVLKYPTVTKLYSILLSLVK